ncbi:MAG: mannose-1-phosphate guanylyltransferase/mannose-6-phosphate isomerase [Pseudomonadales bacterium]|nr:mannose-1-phosphate guanylyltransferase/mannose-6-phosphate isomerase [Pseudomonadales bacterium]
MIIPVVLAGGTGSRLWPLSRQLFPKQFIAPDTQDETQGQTLFQRTLSRLQGMSGLAAPIVICNEEHRFLVAEQLRQLGLAGALILLEPVGRNTAPAVAMAALAADPEATLLVLPADHVIRDQAALQTAIALGQDQAAQGQLVTFGIVPASPETGYGYIQRGPALAPTVFAVQRFVEKPPLAVAQDYLASGDYYWNSGMFLFRADRYLQELQDFAPDMLAVCREAANNIHKDGDFSRIPADSFGRCPAESIDYAVMEKTSRAAVIPLDAQWSDLGSWNSLWETGNRDQNQNVVSGDVCTIATTNSYLRSGSRLVAAIGLKDTIVVETADAVLVADKNHVQSVKQIVQQLEAAGRSESQHHTEVFRPWGSYQSLASGPGFQVKLIKVKPGASLSLQLHHHRAEHWVVLKGEATVTCAERVFTMRHNESTFIPLGSRHRLQNQTSEWVELIEVQTGDYLGEDDIVRFEDVYGRAEG